MPPVARLLKDRTDPGYMYLLLFQDNIAGRQQLTSAVIRHVLLETDLILIWLMMAPGHYLLLPQSWDSRLSVLLEDK